MAELSFATFAVFSVIGWWQFVTYVGKKTNNRLSGWLIYLAITAGPTLALWSVLGALVAVLWGRS